MAKSVACVRPEGVPGPACRGRERVLEVWGQLGESRGQGQLASDAAPGRIISGPLTQQSSGSSVCQMGRLWPQEDGP